MPHQVLDAPPASVRSTDLLRAVLVGLNRRGLRRVDYGNPRFHRAMEAAFDELVKESKTKGFKVPFMVSTKNVHGLSSAVADAVSTLEAQGLLSVDNPSYRFISLSVVPEPGSDPLLDGILGEAVDSITDTFLSAFHGR